MKFCEDCKHFIPGRPEGSVMEVRVPGRPDMCGRFERSKVRQGVRYTCADARGGMYPLCGWVEDGFEPKVTQHDDLRKTFGLEK